MDLDETYQRGVVALGGEIDALQRDKVARRNQAIGAINGAPRAGYQSEGSKLFAIGMAGASAYVSGQAMQGNNLFGSTSEVLPRQIGKGAQHGRSAVSLRGAKANMLASSSKSGFTEIGGMGAPLGTGRGVVGGGWTYRGQGTNAGMRSRGRTWTRASGFSYNYYKV
jgi:hypothetical protein